MCHVAGPRNGGKLIYLDSGVLYFIAFCSDLSLRLEKNIYSFLLVVRRHGYDLRELFKYPQDTALLHYTSADMTAKRPRLSQRAAGTFTVKLLSHSASGMPRRISIATA